MENAQNILANKNQVFEWSIILWSRSFSIIYKVSLLLKVYTAININLWKIEKLHRKENIIPAIPIYYYKKKTCYQEKSVSEKVVTILNHKNHYGIENSRNVNYFIEIVNKKL